MIEGRRRAQIQELQRKLAESEQCLDQAERRIRMLQEGSRTHARVVRSLLRALDVAMRSNAELVRARLDLEEWVHDARRSAEEGACAER